MSSFTPCPRRLIVLGALVAGLTAPGRAAEVSSLYAEVGLRLAWQRPLGPGYSGIAVADGVAVTMFSDRESDFVVALHVASGEEAWRTPVGPTFKGRYGAEDGPSSTPAIADGRVFAAGPHGRLVALDLADGALLWQVDLAERYGVLVPVYGFGATPVPVGDAIYLPAFNRQGVAGLAFAAASGELRWKVAGNWLAYQPAIEHSGGGLLVADVADVALVDPHSGAERFRFTPSADGDLSQPRLVPVGGDRLLLTYETHAHLYRLDAEAEAPMELLWETRELRDAYAPPVVYGDTIYGLAGVFLVAVDLETGARRWKSRRPGARNLALVDGQIVLLASDGDLVVVAADPTGYSERARIAVAERGGYTSAAAAAGRIVVRNTSVVACVEVVEGSRRAESGSAQPLPPAGPFRDFLERLAAADEPDRLLDAWWRERRAVPLVENDAIHFVYRGAAGEVALVGDMVVDQTIPEPMVRLGGTDLFYRSYDAPAGGLWKYAFLVDLERVELDPANPRTTAGYPPQNPLSFGYEPPTTFSLVELPGWQTPAMLRDASAAGDDASHRGRLETVPFTSRSAYRQRDLTVYLPAGYDAGEARYPLLYVLGATPWREHGRLDRVLDRLMSEGVEPAIAVLVPYHKGSLDRMDPQSYADLLLDEIVPLVEQRYRTRAPGALLAAADDGAAAVTAALRDPQRFDRLAVHSLRMKPDEIDKLGQPGSGPATAYVEWSRFEPTIRDENLDYRVTARRVAELLERIGTAVDRAEVAAGPSYLSWSSRLDRSLARLLPGDTGRDAAGP